MYLWEIAKREQRDMVLAVLSCVQASYAAMLTAPVILKAFGDSGSLTRKLREAGLCRALSVIKQADADAIPSEAAGEKEAYKSAGLLLMHGRIRKYFQLPGPAIK